MANHTHGTVNLWKVNPVLRKAKIQGFSHICLENLWNLYNSAAKPLLKMQWRCNYNRGGHQKRQLTLRLGVISARCNQQEMCLSAANFTKISHAKGSHVHHNINPLSLNILTVTLEVIIRILQISSANAALKLPDIQDLKKIKFKFECK